jgi:hypothetical protein
MNLQITFDGSKLKVPFLSAEYNASSGQAGCQTAKYESIFERGPIPHGTYTFMLEKADILEAIDKPLTAKNLYMCQYPPQTGTAWQPLSRKLPEMPVTFLQNQKLKSQFDKTCDLRMTEWGNNRIRIAPDEETRKFIKSVTREPDTFYIHDSIADESQGCIEVNPKFFVDLQNYMDVKANPKGRVTLTVKYPNLDTITTHRNPPKAAKDNQHLAAKSYKESCEEVSNQKR